MVALRKMLPGDRAHVDSMQRLMFPPSCNYLANLDEGQWWIATAKGEDIERLAGFCAIAPSRRWRDCAYLSRAGVMPDFRGNGLQRRFINTRLRWAKAKGYRYVITDTAPFNHASSNSLIGCGFKLYEPTHPWAADGALYWRKTL